MCDVRYGIGAPIHASHISYLTSQIEKKPEAYFGLRLFKSFEPTLQNHHELLLHLLLLRMALDTGGGNISVFFFVFHLQRFVTALTIVVVGEFQIELLLVRREFLLAFDCWFIVAFHAPLDFISLFPDVLAIFDDVMAVSAFCPIFRRVLFVRKSHPALGVRIPELRFDHEGVWYLLGRTAQA